LESEQVVEKMNQRDDFVTYNTLINDISKSEELSLADRTRHAKRLSPNKTTYMCLIDFFCKQDRFDMAYRVLNQMFVSGFSPSFVTMNDVLRGLIRIEDMRNAFEMHEKMIEHTGIGWLWIDDDTLFSLLQGLADEFTYTSLMNAYLDEGKWDYAEELYAEMEGLEKLLDRNEITHFCSLPQSVIYSVFINGLDNNKARTTEIKKDLLMFNYFANLSLNMPILEYHLTLAKNCSHDEFKSLVELVEGICDRGLENAYDYDTILKSDYNKPDGIDDGIVYNLFVIAHCQRNHIDEAYNMYKEMVHYGFACHMFTVFALVELYRYPYRYPYKQSTKNSEDMVNELLWVIQNVLRSCNLNDSEIVNYLNEFNPKERISEALFDVLAEKAKDGLFLKCSYAPASA
jgi:pentatricopeptide repeat protein